MAGPGSLPSHFGAGQTAVLPTVAFSGASAYAGGDYGASWAAAASITAAQNAAYPAPRNGDELLLWNTNGGVGRKYHYMGGGWHYTTVTA